MAVAPGPAGFALGVEVEELRAAAERFTRDVLAPGARDHERAGSWPDEVLAVLRGFSLGEMDVPAHLGGAGGGSLAKVVLVEALAGGDAGGLAAADQPGITAGAVLACPDAALAAEVAAACATGAAGAALVVGGEAPRVEWAPGRPALRWAWVTDGDRLRLVEPVAAPGPVGALAFHASGGVTVDLAGARTLGEWDIGPGAGAGGGAGTCAGDGDGAGAGAPAGGLGVRGRARLWGGAVAVGVARASLDATIAYTTERVVFGRPVAHHQGNAFELAALAAGVHGARLAVRDAAASFDAGDPHAGFWATQAWLTATGAAVAVTDAGIQLLGGHGFLVDHLAEKRFREARMLGLLAGGRDAALDDLAASVLEVPDPVFGPVPTPAAAPGPRPGSASEGSSPSGSSSEVRE